MTAVPGLGPLESAIMETLWAADHPLTPQAITGGINYPGRVALSSVSTVLANLKIKRLVARQQRGGGGGHKAYLYEAIVSRDRHLAGIVRAALNAADDWPAVISLATAGREPGEITP